MSKLKDFNGTIKYTDLEGQNLRSSNYNKGVFIKATEYNNNDKSKAPSVGPVVYIPILIFRTIDHYNLGWNGATGDFLGAWYKNSTYDNYRIVYVSIETGMVEGGTYHEHYAEPEFINAHGAGSLPDIDTHVEEIIIDTSFKNNDCLNDVFNKFSAGDNRISDYIGNFIPEGSAANLTLVTDDDFSDHFDPEYWSAGAVTSEPENYMITITFNTDPNLPSSVGNFSSIILATEFMHEMIHAEMYRKLLAHAQQPEIPWTEEFIHSLKNDFNGLADYYTRWWLERDPNLPATSAQHQLMAEHYIDIMADALSDYDDNQHSQEFYEALSWIGLKEDTVAWNNLSPEQQAYINSQIQNTMQNGPCTN